MKLLLSTIQLWQGEGADELCRSQIELFVRDESFTIANWMISMKEFSESVARTIVGCIPAYLAPPSTKDLTSIARDKGANNT